MKRKSFKLYVCRLGVFALTLVRVSQAAAQETISKTVEVAQVQVTDNESATVSTEPRATATPAATPDSAAILKEEEAQRILGLKPNFGTTNYMDAPPLTSGQKFHLFYRAALDPFVFASTGFQAGISQAENEFPGYGQGGQGYGKRYGATFADQFSSNFFANFFYPTLLKEDPRYFRMGKGGFGHRLVYSVKQEFICHQDKGGRGFAWDNVLGAFTSGSLSNVYYPSTDRGAALTLSRSTISLAYGSLGNLVSEFWPDVSRKLFRHRKKQS